MTRKSVNTGRELEQHVADAYREMGARKVEHDVQLAGHQVDVYIEEEMRDHSLHRIAVEAKSHTSPVGINIVSEFSDIVDRLRRERLIDEGIIVSSAGFSRPARSAAQKLGVRLLELADLDAMVAQTKATQWTTSVALSNRSDQVLRYDVLLSYSNTDKAAVEDLAHRLVREGIRAWLDKWNLTPDEPQQRATEEVLEHCATCAIFVGPSGTGAWQSEEMRAAIERQLRARQGCFRVIAVLLPDAERGKRSRLPSFLATTTWVEFRHTLDDREAFHQLLCSIQGIEPGLGPSRATYAGECPYRGLQYFDVEHTPFFSGREVETGWLLNEVRTPASARREGSRFLAIIGPSGSGKSSLARAGLISALKQGKIDGSAEWPIIICQPGNDPLESLAIALSSFTSVAQPFSAVRDLIECFHNDQRTLHLATRLALRDGPSERRLVLLLDQFEEVFTLCRHESLRQALIDNLIYASNIAGGQTLVLLTLRADFYSKCAAYPTLAAALADHQVLVGPMSEGELRQAIERPAQLTSCEFEPGLVEVLLRDVQNQPGSLPLLQDALLVLWQQRDGQRLAHAAYEAIGRIEGALERRAESVYNQFTETEKDICRQIFLRLTQPGEGTEDTKRRVPLRELVPVEGKHETIEAVVQTLSGADARLITVGVGEELKGEQFVEVAHEALIQSWSRFQEWIEEDREALRIHRRLTEAANEWQDSGRDESFLYHGMRLTGAEEWVRTHAGDLNSLERDFLRASLALREAEQEQKQLLTETFDEMTGRLSERTLALEEAIGRMRAILSSIGDGVILEDLEGNLHPLNAAAEVLLEEMSETFALGPLRELSVEEYDQSEDLQPSPWLLERRRFQVGRKVISAHSAAVRSAHSAAVRTDKGEHLGIVIVLRDVTAEAEAERLKDAFITHVSHELRTPLTAIKGYSELLLVTASGSLDAEKLGFLGSISRHTDNLMAMINELLDFSEMEAAGRLHLRRRPIQLTALVEEIADEVRPQIQEKGLVFQVDTPADLPLVNADSRRLRWAVINLVRNAWQYTPAGGSVTLRLYGRNGQVVLDIADTGIGISPEDQKRLFARFYRVTGATEDDVRGVGLGLYVTKAIVEAHEGSIQVASREGGGCTFSVILPVLQGSEHDIGKD